MFVSKESNSFFCCFKARIPFGVVENDLYSCPQFS